MDDADLRAFWEAGKQAGAETAWTAERIASLREGRSRSLSAWLARRLTADLIFKGIAFLALGVAAWTSRPAPLAAAVGVAAMLATAALALPVVRARRTFRRDGRAAEDVRTATAALLSEVARFRRGALLSLGATNSLLVLACLLIEAAVPSRPLQWAVDLTLLAVPFLATVWVVDARIRASEAAVSACLGELDPEALGAVRHADRRARLVLAAVLAFVSALLLAGLVVLLVR